MFKRKNSKDIVNKEIIEVVLKEPIVASEICGGYTAGTIRSIRYNKNHFKQYKDPIRVFLIDDVACGIQGWMKHNLDEFIEENGLYSTIII